MGDGMLFIDGPFPMSIFRFSITFGPSFQSYNNFGPIFTMDGLTLPTASGSDLGWPLDHTGTEVRIRASADGHAQFPENRRCTVEWTYELMGG
jgi:hypothetical protein